MESIPPISIQEADGPSMSEVISNFKSHRLNRNEVIYTVETIHTDWTPEQRFVVTGGADGKDPGYYLGKDWQHQATNDIQTILSWFDRWPTANLGALTGPRMFMEVDLDTPPGIQQFKQLVGAEHLKQACIIHSGGGTGSDRFKVLYAHPGDVLPNRANRKILGKTVDVRYGGSGSDPRSTQAVIPPSIHRVTGHPYRWFDGIRPLIPPPDALINELLDPTTVSQSNGKIHVFDYEKPMLELFNGVRSQGDGRWEFLRDMIANYIARHKGSHDPRWVEVGWEHVERIWNNHLNLSDAERRHEYNLKKVRSMFDSGLAKITSNGQPLGTVPQDIIPGDTDEEKQLKPEKVSLPKRRSSNPPLFPAAGYYGLAGQIVHDVKPYTEACPEAMYMQLLVLIGNAVDRTACVEVEGNYVFPNLFLACVGETGRAGKGTSLSRIKHFMADGNWNKYCVRSGIESGQGLIYHLRDPVEDPKNEDESLESSGFEDKRCVLVEEEMGQFFAAEGRQNSNVSVIARRCYDSDPFIENMGRNAKGKEYVSNAHLSIIGHVTMDELRRKLKEEHIENGLANRFLWAYTYRWQERHLGDPYPRERVESYRQPLWERIHSIRQDGLQGATMGANPVPFALGPGAVEFYRQTIGPHSAQPRKNSMLNAISARERVATIKLALILAVTDGVRTITPAHLKAAWEIWKYSEASIGYAWGHVSNIWGELDTLLRHLVQAGDTTHTEVLRQLFRGNKSAAHIQEIVNMGIQNNLMETREARVGKRGPRTRWYSITDGGREWLTKNSQTS